MFRKSRQAEGWTLEILAARSGLSARQLKAHESRKPPKTIHAENLKAIAGAFRKPMEELADWVSSGQPTPSAESGPAPEGDTTAKATVLPSLSTLSKRATRERQLELHDIKVQLTSETLPLLGLQWFKLVWSRPVKHDGYRFVVIGDVDDHQGLNRATRKVFKVTDGGKYRVVRWLDESTPFYTSVWALSSEHADLLTPIAVNKQRAALIVRVVHKPPEGSDWRGFNFYGDDKTPMEFGFIVEDILPDVPVLPSPTKE